MNNSNLFSPNDFNKNINLIKNHLKENGIIFIRDILSSEDAIQVAHSVGKIVGNIDADYTGITEISNKRKGNNKKNSKAFTNEGLCLHTDRSPLPSPPNLLMNWMCAKNCTSGEATLVDGFEIFNYMKSNHTGMLDLLSHTDVACFTDGIDTYTGPIFNFIDNMLNIRFRYDQCSFFKFEAKEAVKIFLSTAEKLAKCYDFKEGCGYIVRNDRWLHGRLPFDGYRLVKRIHIKGTF